MVRAQRRERRAEVRRDGDAFGSERDDVVAVELDEATDRQCERDRERRARAKRRRQREGDEQGEERQDERQVPRLGLEPGVRRHEVEDWEDRDDEQKRREARRAADEEPDEAGREEPVDEIAHDRGAEPFERPGQAQPERLRQRRDDEVVEVGRPRALVRARVERVPVVAQVAEQPRQAAHEARSEDVGQAPDDLAPRPDEPAERRQRDDRDLRARPEAAPEREPEQDEVAARHTLREAQHEEECCKTEEELAPVEAVRTRRLPDEVRRPDPEEEGGEHGALLVEHAQADPPDEQRGRGPQDDDDETDRPRVEPEGPDERRGEELLLRAAVALAREERWQRAVHDPSRQEADDRLVRVERALRQEHGPNAAAEPGCRSNYGDHRERAPAHRRSDARTPMPPAHSTKSSGRLA
jgi:hypothetical protein